MWPFHFSFLDLALARLMRIQLKSKFKRDDDSDAGVDVDALHSSDAIEIPFHKRFDNAYTDFHDKTQVGQPSRMSYDPKDFAYKMSPWLQQRDRLKSKTAEEENPEVEENGVEFLANQQKRRWRSRGCDFSRVTHSQFVQFLKTGVLCGRRGYRVRFGLSGRRR